MSKDFDKIFMVYPYQVTNGEDWFFKWEKDECEDFLQKSKSIDYLDTEDWEVMENDEDMVIISLKHTKKGIYTFWRADNAGYTIDLKQAGIYKYSTVIKNLSYYHNGDGAIAIPLYTIESFFLKWTQVEVNKEVLDEFLKRFPIK